MNGPHQKLSALFKLAVVSGVPAAVRHHLNKGDDIEARDGSGATPLIIAAGKGRAAVVELLLGEGADPRAVDSRGLDALAHATRKEAWDIVEALTRALEARLRHSQTTGAVPAFAPQADPVVTPDPDGQLAFSTVEPSPEESGLAEGGTPSAPGVAPQVECGELTSAAQEFASEPVFPQEAIQEPGANGKCELADDWEGEEIIHPPVSRHTADVPVQDASPLLPEPEEEKEAHQPEEPHQGLMMLKREGLPAETPAPLSLQNPLLSDLPASFPAATDPAVLSDPVLDEDVVELEEPDDWEAEPPPVAPTGNPNVAKQALDAQHRIGSHTPVDDGEGWDEIELDLPTRATIIAALAGDSEAPFRPLLAEGLLTGTLSRKSVLDICTGTDGYVDHDLELALEVVAHDLGIRIIEGDVITEDSSFRLNDDDEELLDDAMTFLQDLVRNPGDPLRHYQREMRPYPLLSNEEEIETASAIENAGREAVCALSRWPAGLMLVQEAVSRVLSGHADAELYSTGPEPSQEDEPSREHGADPDDGTDGDTDEVAALFLSAAAELKEAGEDISCREKALEKARLSRGFLMTLADTAQCMNDGREFVMAIRKQESARERMIVSNLRLAFAIARKYLWSGLPLDDLIQEANIGLMKAVERYDRKKGSRFSTYATWWIRQNVHRAVANHARIVRTPVHLQDSGWKLMQSREEEFKRTGQVESEIRTSERTGLPLNKVRIMISQFEEAISLEDPCASIYDLDDIHEQVTDLESCDAMESAVLRQQIVCALDSLDKKAREVIMCRYGLKDNDAMTLEEIGNEFGVTRERIRQIEAKALQKLKHHPGFRHSRSFSEEIPDSLKCRPPSTTSQA